jgi:inner membrane protein
MLVLPFLLTGLLLGIDALYRRYGRAPSAERARPRELLLVSAIAILSHPLLDLMNTYGVRLLSPLSWRWFYADTWFIVDPWVLLALAIGLVISHKSNDDPRPVRIALAVVATYAVMMAALGSAAKLWVRDGATALLGAPPRRVLASPEFANPFTRKILVETDSAYFNGRVRFLPPRVSLVRDPVPRGAHLTPLAGQFVEGQRFLRWSRFPIFTETDGLLVISDARYGGPNTGWARVEIPIGVKPASQSASR